MGQVITTNFKGVVEKGEYESGDYFFEIKDAKADQGKNGVYIKLALQFVEGKYAGLLHEEFVSLAEKALWRAKQFFKAIGYEVPDGEFKFNTDDLLGLSFRCHAEREVDPTGKYPPKLKVTQYWNKDNAPALAPEASPQTPAASIAPAGQSSPVATPSVPASDTSVAKPDAGTARPKLKV
jgi:hypothetical protein